MDVAYGRGDKSTSRIIRKQEKYANLVRAIRQTGITVHGAALGTSAHPTPSHPFDPEIHKYIGVISLGIIGELYTSLYNSMRPFNTKPSQLKPLLLKLHTIAIRHLSKILSTRRKLDRQRRSAGVG